MSSLGSYWVDIVPSMKGAVKQIQSELSGVNVSSVGSDMGKQMSSSMSAAMDMQAIGAQIQGLGSSISSVGSMLTRYITVPLAGAGLAAGGLVATLGWGRLSSIDTAQAQLRGLGYESADVERITSQLTDDLSDGMMAMGDATQAAAGAMAAGVSEGAELTRYIQMLDAATVGGTGTFAEMNKIFSQTADRGHLTALNFDMMTERMTGFSTAMQDHFEVSADEMRRMLNEGEVSLDDFLDVMEDFGGDLATEYAKTWEGMWQNTKNWISIIGEGLLEGVFQLSKEELADFISMLSSEDVQAWAKETGETIRVAFEGIVEAVRGAIDWWQNLDTETKKMIVTFAGIAAAAGPVLLVVGKIVTAIGSLISAIGVIVASPAVQWMLNLGKSAMGAAGGKGIGGLLGSVAKFIPFIGLLVAGFIDAWSNSEEFRQKLEDLWESIQDGADAIWEALEPVLEKAGELFTHLIDGPLGGFVDFIRDVVEPMFIGLVDILQGVWDTIVEVIKAALGYIEGWLDLYMGIFTGDWELAWEGIKQIGQSIWDGIKAIFKGAIDLLWNIYSSFLNQSLVIWDKVWGSISDIANNVWDGIRSFISTTLNTISGLISSTLSSIAGTWSSTWGSISSVASSIWSGITSAISGFMSSIMGTIASILGSITGNWSSAWANISNILSNAWNTIRTVLTNAMSSLRDGISSGIEDVLSLIRELPSRIVSALGDVGNLLVSSGRALINGFTSGIRDAFSGARDAVRSGLSTLRDNLPFSPAKEGPFSGKGYTLFSGQALIEDFGKGIAASSPEAVREMSRAAEAIAAETDISSAIPSFLPDDWTLASTPAVPESPSVSSVPASSGNSSGRQAQPAQFTIHVSGTDPNEVAWKAADRMNEHLRSQGAPFAPIPR